MAAWVASAAIGFVSGVLSGMFGIGGGIVTTPAIRLLLGAPALVAVGTPLPVIIPSAVTGALSYQRRGLADVRVGVVAGLVGASTAVAGALATNLVGGPFVLIATAALIAVAAGDMVLQAVHASRSTRLSGPSGPVVPEPESVIAEAATPQEAGPGFSRVAAIGLIAGAYSGFFGLGGGFVLVPMFTRWLGFSIKRAIGTSLIAVTVLAVPGTVAHALQGNVDWIIAAGLAIGVMPGALLGAMLNARAREMTVQVWFAALLVAAATWLAWQEIAGLL